MSDDSHSKEGKMHLTREESEMLEGKLGYPVQKSMELLVRFGEIYGAERLTSVSSVHLVGGGIVSDGKAAALYVEELVNKGGKFVANTTLDPCDVEPVYWRELGISEETFRDQMAYSKLYERLGTIMCHTCTPYDIGHIPRMGEHIAWGESSAVAFANSVLGARTNREGAPTAIASAITGRTALCGYHLDQNRYGTFKVLVSANLEDVADYGSLGYFVGELVQDQVPVFIGMPPHVTVDQLKALGAAIGTAGAVALYQAVGITPEAQTEEQAFGPKKLSESNIIEVGDREIRTTMEKLSTSSTDEVDLVILGCPHSSISEMKEIAELLSGRKVAPSVELWIFTSVPVIAYAERAGYKDVIEKAGVKILRDTCPWGWENHILSRLGHKAVATNSAKSAFYMPFSGHNNLMCHFGSTKRCIDAALSGKWR